MKIKEGLLIHKMGSQYVAAAIGQASREFHGLVRLNGSGAYLWEQLQTEQTEDALVQALLRKYEVDDKEARKDVEVFLNSVREAGLLYE